MKSVANVGKSVANVGKSMRVEEIFKIFSDVYI